MKKIGELMAELGFREDAPESLKKALMAGVIRSLSAEEIARLPQRAPVPAAEPEQLSLFGPDDLPQAPKVSKVTTPAKSKPA